ncbi:DNA polymerase [Nonomuraea sp. NPDC050451]|uniref:DNA polymerase n=1 Tax=Nonomuraea sp. NPDC050451 TaxID=3364364 RepID=UPI00378EE060
MTVVLGIDTESNGRDYRHDPLAKTTGVSIATSVNNGDYFPFQHEMGFNHVWPTFYGVREYLKDWIERPDVVLVMHNAKHDILALENLGINVRDKLYYCTMLETHFVNENLPNKGLDYVSKWLGGTPKVKSDLMAKFIKWGGWEAIPSDVIWEYAEHDACLAYYIHDKMYPRFKAEGYDGELWERERKFTDLIMRMERLGVPIDQDLCEQEIAYGTERMETILRELKHNPMSGADLKKLLIDEMGIPSQKDTPTGRPSFDKEAMGLYETILEQRNDRTAQAILEYRGWQKTLSSNYRSYLELQSGNGTLHPSFKLHGTRSGRLSCEKPNLQQIPRSSPKRWNGSLKRAFRARPGYRLFEADYSNLELRLAAVYSKEPNLVGPLQQGYKPFDSMAELLHGVEYTDQQRQDVKVQTYMTLYGSGIKRLKDVFGLEHEEAKKRRSDWFGAYPEILKASQKAARLAERRGYVAMWTGRRRHLTQKEGYKAFNSLLQGGAAELVKSVMLALDEVIDWVECRMLLQVHDSVVFEIAIGTEDKWLPLIRETMERVSAFHPQFGTVPFPVDIKEFGG